MRAAAHASWRSRCAAMSTAGRVARPARRAPIRRDEAPATHTEPAPVTTTTAHTSRGAAAMSRVPRRASSAEPATTSSTGTIRPTRKPGPWSAVTRRTWPSGDATTWRSANTTRPPRPRPVPQGPGPRNRPRRAARDTPSWRASAPNAMQREDGTGEAREPRLQRRDPPHLTRPGPGEPQRGEPAGRRCTAPTRAHCPSSPATGTRSSSSATTTPCRVPGSSSRPFPYGADTWWPVRAARAAAPRQNPVASAAPNAVSASRHRSRRSEPVTRVQASRVSVSDGGTGAGAGSDVSGHGAPPGGAPGSPGPCRRAAAPRGRRTRRPARRG